MKRLQGRRTESAQRGVALFECLMAMLIFSVGLLGLLGLEARVMNISVDSENRGRAAMLAGEVASEMWLHNTVLAGDPAIVAAVANVSDQTQGGVPGGAVVIAPVAGTTNAADITVTWHEISDVGGTGSSLTTRVVLP